MRHELADDPGRQLTHVLTLASPMQLL